MLKKNILNLIFVIDICCPTGEWDISQYNSWDIKKIFLQLLDLLNAFRFVSIFPLFQIINKPGLASTGEDRLLRNKFSSTGSAF